ncbi:MAG TPA: Uma2 family endonuclease [Verrucomicrobiae bacterium]
MVQAPEQQIVPVRGAKLWPMTIEAYHILGEAGVIPENSELLYGLVYTKMPKSPFHSFLLRRLLELIRNIELRGFLVSSEQPLTFIDSEPEPDIAVIKGTNDDFRASHPTTAELVIEICVTSHEYDRSKLRAYASGKIKECWLILGPEKKIEVYSEPRDGSFTAIKTHESGEIVRSAAVPQITIDLAALFKS